MEFAQDQLVEKRKSFIFKVFKTPSLLLGSIMILLLVCAGIFAPWLTPYEPTTQNMSATLKAPSSEYFLGTDQLGRDILTRLLYAARTDLKIMVLAVIAPFCIGTFLGMIAGYYGRWLDKFILLLTDIFIAFPFYLIVISISFVSGAGEKGIYITFALVGWIVYARVIRGLAATFRKQEWIASAKVLGMSNIKIIFRHLLPNVLPQAIIVLMTDMVGILVAIVTLGYLGIGIPHPTPDWGTMISDGQSFISTKWWLSTVPGIAIVYTGIALSLIGDGLADIWRIK